MIWTVVMKSGESFIVYGNAPNISEVAKAIRSRGYRRNQVAGVVRGSHEIIPTPRLRATDNEEYYESLLKARRAAMQGPIIRDKSDVQAFAKTEFAPTPVQAQKDSYPDYEQSFMMEEEERTTKDISNDPVDW